MRGRAYLAAGRSREAAAEFQKVLDHRGIVLADPIGALAHWQLGKALVVAGDPIGATRAYRRFLDLWAHADPEVLLLRQVVEDLARAQAIEG